MLRLRNVGQVKKNNELRWFGIYGAGILIYALHWHRMLVPKRSAVLVLSTKWTVRVEGQEGIP